MAESGPSDRDLVACPVCQKRYRRKPEILGKKVRCAQCKAKLRLREEADDFELLEQPPDAEAYEMGEVPTGPHGSGKARCPSCGKLVKATAAICINCGFDLEHGEQLKTRVDKPAKATREPKTEKKKKAAKERDQSDKSDKTGKSWLDRLRRR